MKLLAIDTSQAACSVALWQDGKSAGHRYRDMPKGHAEALIPMLDDLRNERGFSMEELDAFAVTVGPGTFTGLRVGLATARGFAVALGKPCLGVTSLEAIAYPAAQEAEKGELIAACFDARRDEAYLQLFNKDLTPVTEPALVSLDDLETLLPDAPLRAVGTGARLIAAAAEERTWIAKASPLPDARSVAAIASARSLDQALPPTPLYLRAPDAKVQTNPLRKPE
ncbi:MAG: tRNA (adenosine(37)-N6)-threonylcarbamoyltransferase complex dimerization subunit type 1 TsaB [Parvibaculum sp.]